MRKQSLGENMIELNDDGHDQQLLFETNPLSPSSLLPTTLPSDWTIHHHTTNHTNHYTQILPRPSLNTLVQCDTHQDNQTASLLERRKRGGCRKKKENSGGGVEKAKEDRGRGRKGRSRGGYRQARNAYKRKSIKFNLFTDVWSGRGGDSQYQDDDDDEFNDENVHEIHIINQTKKNSKDVRKKKKSDVDDDDGDDDDAVDDFNDEKEEKGEEKNRKRRKRKRKQDEDSSESEYTEINKTVIVSATRRRSTIRRTSKRSSSSSSSSSSLTVPNKHDYQMKYISQTNQATHSHSSHHNLKERRSMDDDYNENHVSKRRNVSIYFYFM